MIGTRFPSYRENAIRSRAAGDLHFTSVIVLHELMYGVLKSVPESTLSARIVRAFTGFDGFWELTEDDAQDAARIRHDLAIEGRLVGPYDLLIAAQALRRDAILVTNNTREFSRIKGLHLLDWNT